jgi:hypothetical protein
MKKLCLSALIILSISSAYSQAIESSSYEVQLIPESPDVAQLGKFGNTPINKYNGTANINIPIYTIKLDQLSIPLSLNYNTSGVKVNEDASWVGLGWSLSEGMTITRDINGFDDIRSHYVNQGGNEDAQSVGWIYSENFLTYQNSFQMTEVELLFLDEEYSRNYPQDTEPDLFNVSLPSGSFKFYLPKIQNNEQILEGLIVDEKNYKVFFDITNASFQVIDTNGFIYDFTNKEYSTGFSTTHQPGTDISEESVALLNVPTWQMNQTKKLNSAWRVSKITSPLNKELNFNYQEAFFMSFPHYSEKQTENWGCLYLASEDDINTNRIISASFSAFHSLYLNNISGEFGSVNFSLLDRTDLFTAEDKTYFSNQTGAPWEPEDLVPNVYNAKKLDNISVYDPNGQLIQSTNLSYSYFNNYKLGQPDEANYLRLKLDEVNTLDQNYSFEYEHAEELAPKDTKSVDFWGFYNGIGNSFRIPSHNRFYLRQQSTCNGNYDQVEVFLKMNGANRKSDITYGKYGNLKKITYPTKGYTEFEYEGNSVTLTPVGYEPVYDINSGDFKNSGINSTEGYNFRYQQLKLANDPDYSLYNFTNSCTNDITQILPNYETDPVDGREFEITNADVCNQDFNFRVSGRITCTTGCANGTPSGNATWLVNIGTGDVTVITTFECQGCYPDPDHVWWRDYEFEALLPLGTYKIFTQVTWVQTTNGLIVVNNSLSINKYIENTTIVDLSPEEFEVGGARLKKVTNFDHDGSFLNSKTLEYTTAIDGSQMSSGKLMDDLIFTSKCYSLYDYSPELFGDGMLLYFHSDNMISTNPSAAGSHVGYSEVSEFQEDSENNTNGKIVSQYVNNENVQLTRNIGISFQPTGILLGGSQGNWYNLFVDLTNIHLYLSGFYLSYGEVYILGMRPLTYDYINGKIEEESFYDDSGNIKRSISNGYNRFIAGSLPLAYYPKMLFTGNVFPVTYPYKRMSTSELDNNKVLKLTSSTTTEYLDGGDITNNIEYFYDNIFHNQLTKTEVINSEGKVTTAKAYYPQDLQSEPFVSQLIIDNRLNTPIKTEFYLSDAGNDPTEDDLLSTQHTYYDNSTSPNGLILSKEVTVRKGVEDPEERIIYEKYDDKGNLLQYKKPDGAPTSLIWGYNKQYPIAKIENASYASIEALPEFGPNFSITNGLNTSEESALRTLSNALVTTYTFEPLVGITSVTDPKGYIIYYEYDDYNRLKFVKDMDGNVLSKNEYNYKH